MNAKNMIAAVAVFAAAGSVFAADNAQYADFNGVQSVKTRAEVRSELEQAYQQRQFAQNKEFVEFTNVASSKSRDDVRKEVLQSAGSRRIDGDVFGS